MEWKKVAEKYDYTQTYNTPKLRVGHLLTKSKCYLYTWALYEDKYGRIILGMHPTNCEPTKVLSIQIILPSKEDIHDVEFSDILKIAVLKGYLK